MGFVTIAIWILTGIWVLMAVVAVTNAVLIPRVKHGTGKWGTVLIPARDEAENLRRLLPQLMKEVEQVIIFDDGSTDGTGDVARELGATVVTGKGELPEGWTGKNHACWQLAKVAAETAVCDWWLFLDADTQVESGFGGAMRGMVEKYGARHPVMTGFPRMRPGSFPEPIFLFWVPWILISTIPFGLVFASGMGHARFTNGQFVMWNSGRYFDSNPHERNRGEVLEDIKIGRMLAHDGVRVLTADVSRVFSVQMYRNLGEAWRGMLKNSFYVTGTVWGAGLLALLMFGLLGVLFVNPVAFLASAVTAVVCLVGTRLPIWCLFFYPLSVLAAGVTQIASAWAVRRGKVAWKGRVY